jgi:nitroreductase
MRLSSFILAGTILLSCISCGNNRSEETVMKEGNPVIENIMARRSIRKYKAEPVSRATMDTILMCGINAPNGMNRQSWEVRVVDKPEVMAEIKEYMKAANPDVKPEMIEGCFRGAPTMVFVANDPAYDFSAIDCGLLSENIMLSAWSLGVGSVCLGSPVRFLLNSPEAMTRLGFSEGYRPIICIGLGYPDESPEAKPRDAGKVKFID